ncbi:glycosyltransferase [Streptacidiphilus sp. EB129]|jgi:hypothetical protein|uniref:glycosyltransferase n=1 Tax=Streptacidiphilus sp. EB129 TaxID=3156262 RepID=UPI0035173344
MDAQRERRSTPESTAGGASGMAEDASDTSSDRTRLTSDPAAGDGPAAVPVAVVIPAHDEASRIALTVLAARRLPGVDLVVVVDDHSGDSTARVAEESGATVVRLPARQGRTAALVAGIAAVTAREAVEVAESRPRHLLFLDADLQQGAAEGARLLEPVLAGLADVAVAARPPGAEPGATAPGGASRRAGRAVERATGFTVARPLALEICLTRAALSAAEPLAEGAGAGPGLIIDLQRRGFRIEQVEVPWTHRPDPRGIRAGLRELSGYRQVRRALGAR